MAKKLRERKEFVPGELTHFRVEDLNKYRKLHGLPPIIPKKRQCLKCDYQFTSQGPNHRLCGVCGGQHESAFTNLSSLNGIFSKATPSN